MYNDTVHSVLKCSPNEMFDKNNGFAHMNDVERVNNKRPEPKTEYNEHDRVRYQIQKQPLTKGYKPKYTTGDFFIHAKKATNPTTYNLINVNGQILNKSFYKQQLKHVKE